MPEIAALTAVPANLSAGKLKLSALPVPLCIIGKSLASAEAGEAVLFSFQAVQ